MRAMRLDAGAPNVVQHVLVKAQAYQESTVRFLQHVGIQQLVRVRRHEPLSLGVRRNPH